MTREEAKTFLCSIAGDLGFTDIENYTCKDGEKMREAIKALEQEPKTGHWIEITNNRGTVIALRCSCCEKSPKHAIRSGFCPNCGADMRGEK